MGIFPCSPGNDTHCRKLHLQQKAGECEGDSYMKDDINYRMMESGENKDYI